MDWRRGKAHVPSRARLAADSAAYGIASAALLPPSHCPVRTWNRRLLACAASVLALLSSDAWAQSSEEVLAGWRQLRSQAAEVAPLASAASSSITRDVGSIAVIEHDGTAYDATANGVPNYAPRASVAKTFYETHGDFYDFLVVFTSFEFDTTKPSGGSAIAFHNSVRSDVQGINVPIGDNGVLFGSPNRLLGYVDMAAISRYTSAPLSSRGAVPLSATPGEPGFRDTLNVLAHEIAHQWLARVRYRDAAGQTASGLLGAEAAHWSYLLDSDGSLLHGADWTPRGDGRYQAGRVLDGYSSLDLYLMGMLDGAKVTPLTLLRSPGADVMRLPHENDVVSATPETVTLDQIIAVEGPRSPSCLMAPKTFRAGFVFLTSPGVEPAAQDLEAVDTIRRAFAAHFFALTRGVGIVETSLAEEPKKENAPAPDFDKAIGWLLSQQALDGRWEDSSSTAIRDTAVTLETLSALGRGGAAGDRARLWLKSALPSSFDFLARRALGIGAGTATLAAERSQLAQSVVAAQNPDDGFGAGTGYASDPLDTALALRSLAALKRPVDTTVRGALAWLATNRLTAGGWPAVSEGGEASTIATAHVLLALQDWQTLPEAQALLPAGLAALLSRRNPDQGFGESPSTAYATALALVTLTRANAGQELLDGTAAWLYRSQLSDGSWDGSTYATALVLAAVNGTAPNLAVPPDALVLDPPAPQEGDTVQVRGQIRNLGRTGAGASVARLYEGDPAQTTAVAETPVPPLVPGEAAEISFQLDTTGRAGTRTLYLVADAANQVAETREDDNASSRALTVTGLLPDLALRASDLRVEPYPPEAGETVQVAVTVRNRGARPAEPCALRVFRGSPHQGGVLMGDLTLPALDAGAALTLTLPWDTTGQEGEQALYAVADAAGVVTESDELNNEAAVPITVTGPHAGGVDLELTEATITPATLQILPQSVEVRARVRNLGRDEAASTVALYDTRQDLTVASQPVSVAGRSATEVAFSVSVTTGGSRGYVVQADPGALLDELSETNNTARVSLPDLQDARDVEIRPEDLSVSAGELVLGDPLEVTAVVRNRGTAPFIDLPVTLGQVAADGVRELGRQLVTLGPGEATTIRFQWKASIQGDPLSLVVRADPFDLLAELSETNNDVPFSVRVRASSLPNLSVSGADVTFAPDPPLEGSSATVSALVRNPSGVAAGPFLVRFYRGDPQDGGPPIGEAALSGLAGGATTVVSITWSAVDVRGAQGLFVVADPLAQVEEYDESDDRAFRPFAVTGLADLVLVTADLSLEPGYPRAGEPVTIRAVVRNLGQQPAGESILRAYEGPGTPGTVVGEATIPALAPGQAKLLEIPWTPAAPEGERQLSVVADADDAVREQDEGNDVARRAVVVQSSELYLTERFFSPNGDGVKDETTLGYRVNPAGTVSVVVYNNRGRRVRTLADKAGASGSATWDGRDDSGRVTWDGTYTLVVQEAGGRALARAEVVLDTNRSAIHEAAGTGLVAAQAFACALPAETSRGPEWLPNDEEALFIVASRFQGFEPGLLRLDRAGSYSYVDQGGWWEDIGFASSVSPDGRNAVVTRYGSGYVVDLNQGTRLQLGVSSGSFTWSPDGRWLLADGEEWASVLKSDGTSSIGALPGQTGAERLHLWAWSPDGKYLAGWFGGQAEDDGGSEELASQDGEPQSEHVRIFRPDGSEVRTIPLGARYECLAHLTWRGDGTIYAAPGRLGYEEPPVVAIATRSAISRSDSSGGYWYCSYDRGSNETALIIDPESGVVTPIPNAFPDSWSPDGSKALRSAALPSDGTEDEVVREDGSAPRTLWPGFDVTPSPWGSVATFSQQVAPGAPCNTSDSPRPVRFSLSNLQNLFADLTVSRLPANNGLLVRGTVSDAQLDHYQFDYAVQGAAEVWYPIGPSSDVPVLDDVLTAWLPPEPGSYVLRLQAWDRAGNARGRTRVVSWDRRASIANLSFDEALISPNDDGTKDATKFQYRVLEPTRVDVRIVGPARAGGGSAAVVRQLAFEHSATGPASFVWDGRDDAGLVVADGRYTVYVNDLPFRIEVDATPPDVAVAYRNLRVETDPKVCPEASPSCPKRVVFAVDKHWHVFDAHLKGVLPAYEPERNANGRIVYDEAGAARPLRIDGKLVDRVDLVEPVTDPHLAPVSAEDHAGNRTTVTPVPLPPQLVLLSASSLMAGCDGHEPDPIEWLDPAIDHVIDPSTECLWFGLFATVDGRIHLEYRPSLFSGAPWSSAPEFEAKAGRVDWMAALGTLNLQSGLLYESRLVLRAPNGEASTPPYYFKLDAGERSCLDATKTCVSCLRLCLELARLMPQTSVSLRARVGEPVVSAVAIVRTWNANEKGFGPSTTYPLAPQMGTPDVFSAIVPGPGCDDTLAVETRVVTESGKTYDGEHLPDLSFGPGCLHPQGEIGPRACEGAGKASLQIRKVPLYCKGTAGSILIEVTAAGQRFVTIERVAEGGPVPVAEVDLLTRVPDSRGVYRFRLPVDVRALPSGDIIVRGRLTQPDLPEPVVARTEAMIPIDTAAPNPEVLLPAEGAQLCLSEDAVGAREIGGFVVRVADAAPTASVGAAYKREGGPWVDFSPLCRDGEAICSPSCLAGDLRCPVLPVMTTGVARRLGWNASGLAGGDYTLRIDVCDEDSNTRSVERRLSIRREPPALSLVAVTPTSGIISPNGDGRSDRAVVQVRTYQSTRLSAEVRAQSSGGAVVRTLAAYGSVAAGVHEVAWDGRDERGALVPDGAYVAVVTAQDPCGDERQLPVALVVDVTPPKVEITKPLADDPVEVSVDVLGGATDANFASFELTYGAGLEPFEWSRLSSASYAVSPVNRIGIWHVPTSEGPYALRLVASDLAENVSEARVPVVVTRTTFVGGLSVDPVIFSPNGDGRRETTSIRYELLAEGRVTLRAVAPDGAIVRTFASGVPLPAGTHQVVWDGLADGGGPAPDAGYDVRIGVESPVGPGISQQAKTGVTLDRAPPIIGVRQPAADAFVTRAQSVIGSIADQHLVEYTVSTLSSSPSDSATHLGSGGQNRSDESLAPLLSLADGRYRLRIGAQDQAENEAMLESPFTVDSTPPRVVLATPSSGAVLAKAAAPIEVRGTVTDAYLESFTLSAGAGAAPAAFDLIQRGVTGGAGIAVGSWKVAALPDGTYTLRLEGVDRAGSRAEALRSVVLDGTPPEAVIDTPAEGGYVTGSRAIVGTAADRNLESWELSVSPGEAAAAAQWSPLASGTTSVRSGSLLGWDPLPADGVYTLRLSVHDNAGHVSTALRTVTVDQTPPAAPTGLAGRAVDRQPEIATVRLTWNRNTEPDLAGYRVGREGQTLTPEPIAPATYDDPGRREGQYPYQVFALDKAGNLGPPAVATIAVDLTPPHVDIQRPVADAVVSGSIDVSGTAWSVADFKEYRLYVGASAEPTSWTLLARSTLPIVAGRLATWDALADGPYVLALEAEDLGGNTARVTRPVVVDTVAPEPPLLVSVTNAPDATSLASTWVASPAADLEGYLVYRGPKLANAPGLVIGELRPYLVAGLTYADQALADGRHCYRIVAMDYAGNMSAPSNEICQLLDNRPPRATIVEPPDGHRFDYPIRVVADTADTDIATVQIQIKPHAETTWTSLGLPDRAAIYEATLDPASLRAGEYDLRAVATDVGGRTDADPPSVTVTYADIQPPAIPTGLVAQVDGRQARLTWNADAEADLVGCHVLRDGERITTAPLSQPLYDEERDPGDYAYTVTAVDRDGNESGQSTPADAHVYKLIVVPPPYPVTLDAAMTFTGEGARPQTTIEMRVGDAAVAAAPASESAFAVPDVPLALEGNLVSARGVDAAGSASIPSDGVLVIRNERPGPVTGLSSAVADHDVTLGWDASGDADRHGHVVRRDGQQLTSSSRVTAGISASGSSTYGYCRPGYLPCYADDALDGNAPTVWVPEAADPAKSLILSFPSALVSRVVLRFGSYYYGNPVAVPRYRIEARWSGDYVPLVRVAQNQQAVVDHGLPMPFATDSLRIVIGGDYVGIAEAEIWKLDALAADATSFRDPAVADGSHDYDVRAIDRYGAESEAATVRVAVGDVQPPAAPIALQATVVASNVQLGWTADSEPDLKEYVVFRDGAQIGTTPSAGYVDAGRPNGSYVYGVRAVDQLGNTSELSDEAVALVAVTVPPPLLRGTARPDGSNLLAWDHDGASGFIVGRAARSGGPYTTLATTGAVRSYGDATVTQGTDYFYVVLAVDALGNQSGPSNEVALSVNRTEPPAPPFIFLPTDSAHPITTDSVRTDVTGGAEAGSFVTLSVNDVPAADGFASRQPRFLRTASAPMPAAAGAGIVSPDGRTIAHWYGPEGQVRLVLVDVGSGTTREVPPSPGRVVGQAAFSPDSSRLAYTLLAFDSTGGLTAASLVVLDVKAETGSVVFETSDWLWEPCWSPEGARLAFAYHEPGSDVGRLAVLDVASGAAEVVDASAEAEQYQLLWRPDGRQIAYFHWTEGDEAGGAVSLRVVDVATHTFRTIHDGIWDDDARPSWSPDGRRLAFVLQQDGRTQVVAFDLDSGILAPITDGTAAVFSPAFDPTGRWLAYNQVQQADDGPRRQIVAVDQWAGTTVQVGEPQPMGSTDRWSRTLPIYQWTASGRLALSVGEATHFFTPFTGAFEFEDVRLVPGENVLVARSVDVGSGLVSPDSEPVSVTVSGVLLPDLVASSSSLVAYPAVPVVGRAATVTARAANGGTAVSPPADLWLTVFDDMGRLVASQVTIVGPIEPGSAASVSGSWTPTAPGTYRLSVTADPGERVEEIREDNNVAAKDLVVAAVDGVVTAEVEADRSIYPAATAAIVRVSLLNAGPSLSGTLTTTVEDATGVVAVLDERAVSIGYGGGTAFSLAWNTGRTYAGSYAFRVRLVPTTSGQPVASDEFPFGITSDLALSARLVPRQKQIEAGRTVVLDARLENRGTNTPLLGTTARLRVRPRGASDPIVLAATAPVPTLLPGGVWTGSFEWPATAAPGIYDLELAAFRPGEPALATAGASIEVTAAAQSFTGGLTLSPAHVLPGEATDAALAITNLGSVAAPGLPVAVEVVEGSTGAVLARGMTTLDLEAGQTVTATVRVETGPIAPGAYAVFLRAGSPSQTLDRTALRVHGPITAPAIDTPADGSRVANAHPTLVVRNASSAEGASLVYEFELSANAELTLKLPAATDVAEGVDRTTWTVAQNLTEDHVFYWRARATDGFSTSAWTDLASFTVDAERVPPLAPLPESPAPGGRVASRQPTLVVGNAFDPDSLELSYEYRLAADPEMTSIVASAAGVPAGTAFTSWPVPITLDEDATYYWCARARDEAGASPWSAVVSFLVHSVNAPPTAPVPLQPPFGDPVATLTPSLVVQNADDPEGAPLSYRFQIDRSPAFDSPDRQQAEGITEAPAKTSWTPPAALVDHTTYYWRAAAFDGASYGPWGGSELVVNLANEAPAAPVPQAPANGQVVTTQTPELRVQNASDPDHDALTYDFRVTDAADQEVASVSGVREGAVETAWTVPNLLAENGSFSWSARARDAELDGPWTVPWRFRVNSVEEPPRAPSLVAPIDDAALDTRRPDLVVGNAESRDGEALTYSFELSSVAADGSLTLVERATGVPEGSGTTTWTPAADLSDGNYSWTARAQDPHLSGPWMDIVHFQIAVDRPPSPPTGLEAVPGDARVSLTWRPSSEPDVAGYRVYRALTSGGPYAPVAETSATSYLDLGVGNGATVYYVVTALDARFESGHSAEVAATPVAPTTITAEVWYRPDLIDGDCLFSECHEGQSQRGRPHEPQRSCDSKPGADCPEWVESAIALPRGYDPAAIDLPSVRLAGAIPPLPSYSAVRDEDGDGLAELHLRFAFDQIAPLLHPGANELFVSGRAAGVAFQGVGRITLEPLEVTLRIAPQLLHKRSRSCGQDILADLRFRCADPKRVGRESLRLNGLVSAHRILNGEDHHLILKFDRRAVLKILPAGDRVRVEVTGTIAGVPFTAVDFVRVME